MFRFALKCLHLDKNGKNIYENEMCKLINIFYPLVDSSHSQSKLSQWPSFQKIKTLKNQQFFFIRPHTCSLQRISWFVCWHVLNIKHKPSLITGCGPWAFKNPFGFLGNRDRNREMSGMSESYYEFPFS